MPLLKKVSQLAQKYGIPCRISMEENMACGIGACLVCACKTKKDGIEQYSRVCKDGPVFWSDEVVFE
jgi:dihydroorotate dehydrogenase electron transfer subunit